MKRILIEHIKSIYRLHSELSFVCICFNLIRSLFRDNLENAKNSQKFSASAQSAAVHEMNQKKAANNDIIKAVSGNVIAYPLMFFACGMTVRALAKGLSSCIKGGKKPIQT